ncbi:RIO1 family protein [compost metagenome]
MRVPQPINFHDGVLLMELVTDANGDAAPRLNDVSFTPEDARTHHATLVAEVVRMLCAGVVHGDLSEFNILLAHLPGVDGEAGEGGSDGPVIIDLPQAVDAAGNNHAQRMLMRDVANLRDFFGQFAPELRTTQYGPEIWSLYQTGLLSNETPLTGRYAPEHVDVDMQAVLREIDDARDEDAARRLRMATAA